MTQLLKGMLFPRLLLHLGGVHYPELRFDIWRISFIPIYSYHQVLQQICQTFIYYTAYDDLHAFSQFEMNVLLRHTILGEGIRLTAPHHFPYAEELDPAILKRLNTLEDARSDSNHADESSALLANGEQHYGSGTLLVDWYDTKDSENPLNWPTPTKVAVTAVLCVVTVAMYTGSAFWSVCIDDAVVVFNTSNTVAQLGTSFFVIGFGLGPMIFSPLSELPSVGRLRVYFWTAIAFIIFQTGLPYCTNIQQILALRFFTGFLCSPVLAVGGGTIADLFGPSTRGYPMAVWELATWGGSAIGPTFAGFTYERFGYKGPMWELVFLAIVGTILIVCCLPETLPAAILHQRARRLRRTVKSTTFVTYNELEETQTSFFSVIRHIFVKAIVLNFQEPIVFVLNLYVALVFAIFFGMLESYPYVFKQAPHNFNSGETGLTFLGIFAGGLVSMTLYILFLKFHQDHRFDEHGNITPEERLWPAIPGGLFVPIGLFWYGWTTHLHWIFPVLGGFWFGIGMFTIFMAALSYLPDAYPAVAATVIAGNCLMRAGLAAAFPLFTIPFYERFGAGVATSVLGVLGLLFVPWPIILFYRGHRLRMRSGNARKDI